MIVTTFGLARALTAGNGAGEVVVIYKVEEASSDAAYYNFTSCKEVYISVITMS